MTTIKASLEDGNLLLQEPLPRVKGRIPALVILAGDPTLEMASQHLPKQKLGAQTMTAEEEFEAIGFRDFFGDPVDERINWEKFFHAE